MKKYKIELSEEQVKAVLLALGGAAWWDEAPAYEMYDNTFKEVSQQTGVKV